MASIKELQERNRDLHAKLAAAEHERDQWKSQHDAAQAELRATNAKLRALEAAAEPYRKDDKRINEAFEKSNLG